MKYLIFVIGLMLGSQAYAILTQGQKPPRIILSGENGSLVTGEAWNSDSIKGKVYTLFYVDPDEKSMNEHVEDALKAANFPKDKFGSIAVINLDATWIPNVLIENTLEEKQKKFPKTIYVKDKKKVLVKKWSIKDNSYATIVFDQLGRVIFQHDGKMSDDDVKKLISTIRSQIKTPAH